MTHSKIPSAQTVACLCKAYGIKHIVISPGSRSAPLTIEFTNNDTFKCYSIVDERCAGFFALGIAQQLQKPVALVCTSGSALLNYYPAISEAYYSHIPLVVLSADRPKHLIDIGDGQTIKQHNVYGEYVHYSANLKLDLRASLKDKLQDQILSYNKTEIQKALEKSLLISGPVHINIPFDEPLYNKVHQPNVEVPLVSLPMPKECINKNDIMVSVDIWNNAKRKLILVGVLQPNTVTQKWIDELAKDESVLIFTETTSNLHHRDIFPSIDTIIAPLETSDFKKLQPDVLLTLGGMVISKKIKAFLRQYKPKHHWHIDEHRANDTFFSLNHHFKVSSNVFFSEFIPKLKTIESNYKKHWLAIREHRKLKQNDYLKTISFSDFTVFNSLLKTIPQNTQLQVGNSSAIRYVQLFNLRNNVTVFCNRGTSGIDGSTTTAIGASVVSKERVTFITGDLSFFYDSNALWNNYIPKSFRIIVVNNQGGGIFRILPGHKNTENFDRYFETKHSLTAKQLSEMYDFEYNSASNDNELNNALEDFYKINERPKLLEVFTPSRDNDEILLNYFKFVT